MDSNAKQVIHAADFDSPLALLSHLLDRDDLSIRDLWLYPVVEEYIAIIDDLSDVDLDLSSAFLYMAATLLLIKSASWLPSERTVDTTADTALAELEWRLLTYRRCRFMADDLKDRLAIYEATRLTCPKAPSDLGIKQAYVDDAFSPSRFMAAMERIGQRNALRFQDVGVKVRHLLERERVSVKDMMVTLMSALRRTTSAWFHELCSALRPLPERIASFLAVLELVHEGRIDATQNGRFAPLKLTLREENQHALR